MKKLLPLFVLLSVLFLQNIGKAQVTTCPAPMPGTTNCFQTSRPNSGNPLINIPPIPNQDCCNAIPVLVPFFQVNDGSIVPAGAPQGTIFPGCIQNELPADANTCFSNNEKATVWYKFQVGPLPGGPTTFGSPAGKLRFKIVPSDVLQLPTYNPLTDDGIANFGDTDFDFLLFDVTNAYTSNGDACTAIINSNRYGVAGSLISRCNWTGTRGPTGLFEPGTGIDGAQGPSTRFNKPLSVKVGQIFYLAIDNFSVNPLGFQLDFRGLEAPDDSTAILFSPDQNNIPTNLISGSVFQNLNNNCVQEINEPGLDRKIILTNPGPAYSMTNSAGRYNININAGTFEIKQMISQLSGLLESQYCPDSNGSHNATFTTADGDTASNKNFANNVVICPMLKIGVSSNQRRRCARNQTRIKVWNIGYAASPANTTVYWKLPKYINLISANLPFTFNPVDSTYSTVVGAIPPQGLREIILTDSVICIPGIMGLQQCTKAWVTPPNDCAPEPPGWDGTDLLVKAKCQNNLPTFTIKNAGNAMGSPRNYRVFVDSVLVLDNPFQLGANDSLVFQVPGIVNQTVRVEVPQSAFHPFETFAFAQIQCGISVTSSRINFSPITGEPETDVECMIIRDSYDPNDKNVVPAGTTAEGRIAPRTPLEYKIRFQNTGNDIAYRVVIVDTLSQDLDLSTFQELGYSHPYTLTLSGRGKPVLRFSFPNINLPDSMSNPELSQGYVRFRISPKADAPLGTRIRNQAEIYFDFNAPIITNKTLNTLYVPSVVPGIVDSVIVLDAKSFYSDLGEIKLMPNPSQGKFRIIASSSVSYSVFSVEGKILKQENRKEMRHEVDLQSLRKGFYFIKLENQKGEIQTRKIILE